MAMRRRFSFALAFLLALVLLVLALLLSVTHWLPRGRDLAARRHAHRA